MSNTTSYLVAFIVSLALLFSSFSRSETSEPAFISDALFVYIHSGPSNQYRIVGTVNAGDNVRLLAEDEESGYVQIQFEGNRQGWLPGQYVTNTPGMAVQLAELTEQLEQQSSQLQQLEQSNQQLNTALQQREQEYQKAQEQLQVANRSYEQLQQQFDVEHGSIWKNPKVLGAAILGIGLLFGLLLPLLIPRRKESERWM
ncbi:TIGR04211 family SH3 domain-containing protein [Alkalimonas collagenimarina]|uniref:TIGR04211 family SH3 domain-containing protein n=1 Tax=Alkalimonas collagenimarina TaxID=400390 RepID=A0ABT9GZR6_9GAMM|nr:TIGR04211 family SH3 domain-containing protein [Alkalimonas collagenimarina]MDP4536170.1 TIGR04211 family SH3 domain-containing protein [Alkalimonas collagenimarina]